VIVNHRKQVTSNGLHIYELGTKAYRGPDVPECLHAQIISEVELAITEVGGDPYWLSIQATSEVPLTLPRGESSLLGCCGKGNQSQRQYAWKGDIIRKMVLQVYGDDQLHAYIRQDGSSRLEIRALTSKAAKSMPIDSAKRMPIWW
jgi:hypothetical protein